MKKTSNLIRRNRNVKVAIVAVVLSVTSFHASDQHVAATGEKIPVDFSGVRDLGIQSAYLQKVDVQAANKTETKFRLSLSGFAGFENEANSPKKRLVLTASGEKGVILGRQFWCSASLPGSGLARNTLLTLYVNSKLQNAQAYSLTLEESLDDGITCKECGELAVATCGKGNVASVTCGGTDGSCAYTCQGPGGGN